MSKPKRKISKRQLVAERILNHITYGRRSRFQYNALFYGTTFLDTNGRRITSNHMVIPDWVNPVNPDVEELPTKADFEASFPELIDKAEKFKLAEENLRKAVIEFDNKRLEIYLELLKEIPDITKVNKSWDMLSEQEEKELSLKQAQQALDKKKG